jgi:phosphate transport system substrate-binding protein
VVGRTGKSGSRRILEKFILGTEKSPVRQANSTSDSCGRRRQGAETAKTIVCEQSSTVDLLGKVQSIENAIGYADTPDATQKLGVKRIQIDRHDPTLTDIRAGYPFWTVEYLYSYGPLPASSLATAFADYLVSPEGRNTTGSFGYYTCSSADGVFEDLCRKGR